MKYSKSILSLAAIAVSGLWAAGSAQGAVQLLQFEPIPVSPGLPEFTWTGPGGNFVDGAGAHGNGYPTYSPVGDGNLPVATQTPGGLQVDTPLIVAAPATAGETIDASGSHFFDVTMTLSSLTPAGGPTGDLKDNGNGAVLLGISVAVQPMTDGAFSMYATDGTLLLSGTLQGNSFSTPLNSTAAGFQSGTVTYTGGAIFTELVRSGANLTGSGAISMTTLDGPVVVNQLGAGAGGFLNPAPATINAFDANATGVFDIKAIPEPASIGLLAVAGIMGLRRRR